MFRDLKDTVRFDPIKEDRGTYIVEYYVPIEDYPFATVELAFVDAGRPDVISQAMEAELDRWARRFPAPIMVTAFDDTGSVIHLEPTKPESHLFGWIDGAGTLAAHWQVLRKEQLPRGGFPREEILAVYKDVPHKWSTAEDKRKSFEKAIRQSRTIVAIVVVWFVLIPVAIALLDFFSFRVSVITLIVSILTGLWKLAGYMGWRKKSKRQEARNAEELRMKHHHYYCERNPEGFSRLVVEVIEREQRERFRKEVEELRRKEHEHPRPTGSTPAAENLP